MSYERIVSAALAETTSKFRLAEALALDIPRRRQGGDAGNEQNVEAELAEARQRIIDEGGEPRHIKTLEGYRKTALWVMESESDLAPTFRWIPGVSYSAHTEARASGLTYAQFVAMPSKTVDAARTAGGRPGTDGKPEAIVSGWTPEQRAAALRELVADEELAEEVGVLRDSDLAVPQAMARLSPDQQVEAAAALITNPAVADEVTRDPQVRSHMQSAVERGNERAREQRENEHPPRLQPEPERQPNDDLVDLLAIGSMYHRANDELLTWIHRVGAVVRRPDIQDALRTADAEYRATWDAVLEIVNGGESVDDAIARLMEQEGRL